MKTEAILTKSLVETLEDLTQNKHSFEEIVRELFSYTYNDYNLLFELDKVNIQDESYKRVPVFNSENCAASLKVWGLDNATAIHDHNPYERAIKVLKGSLTIVNYRENTNFIEYNGVEMAFANQIFREDHSGIHSIVNNSDEITVSLHIYSTQHPDLRGVRIFDTKKRKIGRLNDKAQTCSWNLAEEAYEEVISV